MDGKPERDVRSMMQGTHLAEMRGVNARESVFRVFFYVYCDLISNFNPARVRIGSGISIYEHLIASQ